MRTNYFPNLEDYNDLDKARDEETRTLDILLEEDDEILLKKDFTKAEYISEVKGKFAELLVEEYKTLYMEIKISVGLYKEALEKQDEALVSNRNVDKATKDLHEAREYMFTFLKAIPFEEDLS